MPRPRRRQKTHATADVHIWVGKNPPDAISSAESCRIDAAADREWFKQNPGATKRERPASIRELKASGLLPGTLAVIFRGPNGTQFRIFIDAAEQN